MQQISVQKTRMYEISATAILSVLFTSGCQTSSNSIPDCSPALTCATVEHLTSGGNCPSLQDAGYFKGGNKNPHRKINVTYELDGVALNPPPPSPATTYVQRQGVDYGVSNEIVLGCEMVEPTPGTGRYVQYTYTPVSACFQDDPQCIGETDIAQSHSVASCLNQAHCTGPDCIDYSFNSVPGSPIEQAARAAVAKTSTDILTAANLTTVDLTTLLTGNAFCATPGRLTIQGNSFQQIGSTCDGVLIARTSPPLGVHVYMASALSGTFSRTLGTVATFDFPNQYRAIRLEWLDGNGSSLGFEYVAKVIVTPGTVKIVGSRHYCIWVHPGGDFPRSQSHP